MSDSHGLSWSVSRESTNSSGSSTGKDRSGSGCGTGGILDVIMSGVPTLPSFLLHTADPLEKLKNGDASGSGSGVSGESSGMMNIKGSGDSGVGVEAARSTS
jgi:hypothetical protein